MFGTSSLSLTYFYYQGFNLSLKRRFSNQLQPRYNPQKLSDYQGLFLPLVDCSLPLQTI